jgi:hypothetical protein
LFKKGYSSTAAKKWEPHKGKRPLGIGILDPASGHQLVSLIMGFLQVVHPSWQLFVAKVVETSP